MLPIKKSLFHPRADEQQRAEFKEIISKYEQQKRTIVYTDESGFAFNMPRTHGYSPKGARCYGEKDWHARGRINVIGASVNNTLLTVCLFELNINSDVFFAWLTKDLLPKVPPNSVIVMDNATFHKRKDMIQAIKSQGHTPEYLPPYSPDLNPIEHKWAQAKAIRKKCKCSVDDVFNHL